DTNTECSPENVSPGATLVPSGSGTCRVSHVFAYCITVRDGRPDPRFATAMILPDGLTASRIGCASVRCCTPIGATIRPPGKIDTVPTRTGLIPAGGASQGACACANNVTNAPQKPHRLDTPLIIIRAPVGASLRPVT